ncbi:MAG: hypothetical protein ACRDNO_11090 [Trebonia sp.]
MAMLTAVPPTGTAPGTGRRSGWRRVRTTAATAALAVVAATAFTACSAPAPARPKAATTYYLALGDSLSRGVQPDATGASVETARGYPDLVYARLRHGHPGLRLVQLGCPGETTETRPSRWPLCALTAEPVAVTLSYDNR